MANSRATTTQAAQQGMLCDMSSPAQATPLTYTGIGVAYNNTPLVPVGPGGTLVLNGSAAGPSALAPAPTNITTAGVYGVLVGGPCRVEGATSYMYCPAGEQQNDAAEQFALFPATGSSLSAGTALTPGTPIHVKSVQTGKFCRVVPVADKQQILCDVASPSGASTMNFTGSGFSYQGQGFSNYGSSQPLQLSRTPGQGSQAQLAPSECSARAIMASGSWLRAPADDDECLFAAHQSCPSVYHCGSAVFIMLSHCASQPALAAS